MARKRWQQEQFWCATWGLETDRAGDRHGSRKAPSTKRFAWSVNAVLAHQNTPSVLDHGPLVCRRHRHTWPARPCASIERGVLPGWRRSHIAITLVGHSGG